MRVIRPDSPEPAETAGVSPAAGVPLVVAINMGYGHLRPAHALADLWGTAVGEADREPLAPRAEQKLWFLTRRFYEVTSRASQLGALGVPWRHLLDLVTDIPHLHPYRDLSLRTLPVQVMRLLAELGLGQGLVAALERHEQTLVTTFYTPAVLTDYHGYPRIVCVVTDVDVSRVWAPIDPPRTRIHYCVPGKRTRRRLIAYGVPREKIHVTGFPLPGALLGGPDLTTARRHLVARLGRLDPKGVFTEQYGRELQHFLGTSVLPAARAPRLTFAVGGAGAQAELVRRFLPSLRHELVEGRLQLTLVAGVRREVLDLFEQAAAEANIDHMLGSGQLEILIADSFPEYLTRFNALLAETDILWTKPSEMTFFAALGLPLVLSHPVGTHEGYNRRWAVENGSGVKQRDPRFAGYWIRELLKDGTFAHAAWSGYMRLPKFGLYRIAEIAERVREER